MTPEQNYRLLQELDANRRFMLMAYRDNPTLLAWAETGIRMRFLPAGIEKVADCEAATSESLGKVAC